MSLCRICRGSGNFVVVNPFESYPCPCCHGAGTTVQHNHPAFNNRKAWNERFKKTGESMNHPLEELADRVEEIISLKYQVSELKKHCENPTVENLNTVQIACLAESLSLIATALRARAKGDE